MSTGLTAVLLAGGRGTRLKPYTLVLPKPLMPIGELPVLEVMLQQLGRVGVTRVVLCVGYLREILFAYLEPRRASYPFTLEYVTEHEPMGTVGPVTQVEGLTDTFLLGNGDVLTTLDYADLVRFHKARGAAMTVATAPRDVKIDYGVLEVDANQRITGQIEKPTYHYDVSMGVYVVEPRALALVPRGMAYDVPELIRELIRRGEPVLSYKSDCYWLDIGRHDDYAVAVQDFERMHDQFLPR